MLIKGGYIMVQDPLTLYKLIILYMLGRVKFPLTTAQISSFILEKEYTNFMTLQQVISELINQDFKENEYSLREEISVQGDYYKSTSGEYEAHLIAKEQDINLIELTLSVPTREIAESVCDNWQKKNQEVYEEIIKLLF